MTNAQIMTRWFEDLWNRGAEATIDELLADDMVAHGLAEGDLLGKAAFRQFYRDFRAAFPIVRITMAHVLEAGEYVVCQMDVEVVSADGRGPFRFTGSTTTRLEEGRLAEAWNNFDFLALLTSMGKVAAETMPLALAEAAGAA